MNTSVSFLFSSFITSSFIVQGLEPYVHIDPSYKDTLEHAIGIMLIGKFLHLLVLFFSVFCSVLNFLSLEKFASRFQIVVTVAKTVVLATIIGIGAYSYLFTGKPVGF